MSGILRIPNCIDCNWKNTFRTAEKSSYKELEFSIKKHRICVWKVLADELFASFSFVVQTNGRSQKLAKHEDLLQRKVKRGESHQRRERLMDFFRTETVQAAA